MNADSIALTVLSLKHDLRLPTGIYPSSERVDLANGILISAITKDVINYGQFRLRIENGFWEWSRPGSSSIVWCRANSRYLGFAATVAVFIDDTRSKCIETAPTILAKVKKLTDLKTSFEQMDYGVLPFIDMNIHAWVASSQRSSIQLKIVTDLYTKSVNNSVDQQREIDTLKKKTEELQREKDIIEKKLVELAAQRASQQCPPIRPPVIPPPMMSVSTSVQSPTLTVLATAATMATPTRSPSPTQARAPTAARSSASVPPKKRPSSSSPPPAKRAKTSEQ